MTRIGSWLVDTLSRALERDERDAVQGDLVECRATDRRALRDLGGLVIRRQAELWWSWRPWLVLFALVLPLGMVLSLLSRYWAYSGAIYAWFYVNNWTTNYLASPGARLDLITAAANSTLQCVTLMCWAWTIGFAMGSLSRGTVWLNGGLFALVVFAGTLGSTTAAVRNPANAAVFSLPFYRVGLPALIRIAVVLLPALRGMLNAVRRTDLPFFQALLWTAAVVMLTMFALRTAPGLLVWGWWSSSTQAPTIRGIEQLRGEWELRLWPFVMAWPAAYMLARARWRHRRRMRVSS